MKSQHNYHIETKEAVEKGLRAEKAASDQLRRDVKELNGRV